MACPVCFNAAVSDETVRTSLNLGIVVLLGVTVCVLAGFVRFIASIARRSTSRADLKVGLYADAGLGFRTDVEANPQGGVEADLRSGAEADLQGGVEADLQGGVEADLQVRLPRWI